MIKTVIEEGGYRDIENRWDSPVEGFVPFPEMTKPLEFFKTGDIDFSAIEKPKNEVILAHETTESNAQSIMKNGFQPSPVEMSPLRNRAVFGWIYKDDIGHFSQECKEEADHTVIFTTPKHRLYVSPYESAYGLGLYGLDEQDYEKHHVLKYTEYRGLLDVKPNFEDKRDLIKDSI